MSKNETDSIADSNRKAHTIYTDSTHSVKYYEHELDFDTVYDYWDKLKHQYVGMVIQGMVSRSEIGGVSLESFVSDVIDIATAAVEKLKSEE